MRKLKIPTLPSKKVWVDADEVMLHACFHILTDCVENENVDTHCNYEHHKDFVDEVRFLYNWWKKRLIRQFETVDYDKDDDEMLIRLLKIRTQLWT